MIKKQKMKTKKNYLGKTRVSLLFLFLISLTLTSCADIGIADSLCLVGHKYGFWGGFWHGLITPFSFIGSLFNDEITIYAVNNNGGWYDFGFLLSVGGLGFIGKSSRK